MTTPVTIDEIIKSINFPSPCKYYNGGLINRIREHGIAQESQSPNLLSQRIGRISRNGLGGNEFADATQESQESVAEFEYKGVTIRGSVKAVAAVQDLLEDEPQNIQQLIGEIDGIPNLNNDSMWKAHVMFALDKWRAK